MQSKTKNLVPKFLLLFTIFVISSSTYGQNLEHFEKCGHELVLQALEKKYPGYQDAVNKSFVDAQKQTQMNTSRNEELIIKVVFHIVWKNAEENLADSIIQSQLDVLNEDFRLLNKNKDDLRPIFKDVQGNAGIFFELQEIKRVKTNANFALSLFGLPDNVKRGNDGGSDAADPNKILNIWICKIQPIPFIGGQILGYAYPPADLFNWPAGSSAPSKELEGVVVDFRAIGRNNPNKLNIQGQDIEILGRTCVHEIGHYLGLRHIWGDGGGLFGGESCDEDDGMIDTPNQGFQSSFVCDLQNNTCIDDVDDLPDMIENYMDYSLESCQNTFTKNQVEHMRSVLMNQRSGLIGNQVNAYDIFQKFDSYSVYPNPSFGDIIVTFDNDVKITKAILYNTMGQVVWESDYQNTNSKLEINTLNFSDGQYFLKIVDSKGNLYNNNLVIKND